MYHSGLNKATETGIDKAGSKEALKCLANALLLKPTTRPYFEKLEGHGQCSVLLKVVCCIVHMLKVTEHPPTNYSCLFCQ